MNVVIYARFSSHSQTEQSIEGQLKVCYDYAAQHSYTVIAEYIDRAISGKTDDRPQFQQMIDDSSRHLFEGVLVYQLDRFARNRYDSAIYKKRLQKNGVRVFSAKENIADDPSGILIESVLEGMAEYYSAELAVKIRRGMDLNGEKCLVTGGGTALGFKVDKETKKYVIDEERAPVVRRIFEMYADGSTVADICRYMNAHGVKTSQGNEFNKNSLRKMLTNKRYIGIYTYKGKETPGGMPRIIDDDLFYRVQEKMQKNKKAPARARAKEEYLLTTKLFCGHCGEMMTGYGGTGKSGKVHHYYICNGVKRKSGCHKKTVRKQYIEDLVIDVCRKMLTDENIDQIVQGLKAAIDKQPKNTELEAFRKELKDVERKRANLLNAVMECNIDLVRQSLYEQLEVIEQQRSELEYNISVEEKRNTQFTPEMVAFFLYELKKGNADDPVYRRALVATFINKVFLYDDKITVHVNTGGDPVEITGELMEEIEKSDAEAECSFKGASAPPNLIGFLIQFHQEPYRFLCSVFSIFAYTFFEAGGCIAFSFRRFSIASKSVFSLFSEAFQKSYRFIFGLSFHNRFGHRKSPEFCAPSHAFLKCFPL